MLLNYSWLFEGFGVINVGHGGGIGQELGVDGGADEEDMAAKVQLGGYVYAQVGIGAVGYGKGVVGGSLDKGIVFQFINLAAGLVAPVAEKLNVSIFSYDRYCAFFGFLEHFTGQALFINGQGDGDGIGG